MLERFFKRPIIFVLGCVLLLIAGISSMGRLSVDLFPDMDYPLINIITHAPAGTAQDIEQLITRPIENSMLGLTDLQRVRSVSAPGFSQVTVEFRWGIDVLQARQIVASRLSQVEGALPPGVRPEIENIGTSLNLVSTYGIGGSDPIALRGWVQYQLAPRLESIPGIARVQVMGGGVDSFRVDLDPEAMAAHRVSPRQVVEAIGDEHVLDTGGYIESNGRELLIRTDGLIRDATTLEGITVRRSDVGRPVLLGDVARVYRGALPERYRVTVDRRPAVVFSIQKQPGASTLGVSRAVDRMLGQMPPPSGARAKKFYDQAEIIALAYRNMRNNLLIGALLAVLTLVWVLGNSRTTWVVAVTLPLTVLGTFMLMDLSGLGLNLMTLSALTVAIGLIDDDAVIVLENIDRHREMGKSPMQAAADGLREIFSADLSGTLTVISAFVPLLLVTGLAGRLFRPFGLTFSFMLTMSFALSVLLIPVAAAHWLPRPDKNKPKPGPTLGARMIGMLERLNDHLLRHLLRHRALTIATTIVILIASLGTMVFNPVRFVPLLDEDSLLVSYQLAPGTALGESNRFGDELESRFLAIPSVGAVFRRTGSPEGSFYLEGPDQGELVVRLRPDATKTAEQVKGRLERVLSSYPGVIGRVNEPTTEKIDESFSGLPALFGITVYAPDLKTLYDAASKIEQTAGATPFVKNIVNNTKVPFDQIKISIDRDACVRLGVEAQTVARAVRLTMQGESAGTTIIDQQPLQFFVRLDESSRNEPDVLGQLPVHTRDGRAIPLGMLTRITHESGYPLIEHQHGVRSLTMAAELVGNPLVALRQLDRTITGLGFDPSVQVAYAGEYRQLISTASQAGWALLAAAILVFGIVAFQLGSALDAMIVLVKLPIDFMGAAVALFIMRQPLDVTLPLGLITLVGVSVNNAIVLMTFTRNIRVESVDASEAVRRAVALRFRPMVLTHLTTLLALIPAAIGFGRGPQLLQPLGIMLFGGLTAGTLLTLNLLPVLYVSTDRFRRRRLAAVASESD